MYRIATEDETAVHEPADSISPDTVNNRGQTPLATALLGLIYYRNTFTRPNTAVYYGECLMNVVSRLVPLTDNINSWWDFLWLS